MRSWIDPIFQLDLEPREVDLSAIPAVPLPGAADVVAVLPQLPQRDAARDLECDEGRGFCREFQLRFGSGALLREVHII